MKITIISYIFVWYLEKPPVRDRHDWPLAAKPAPPVRSSSQPSVREERRSEAGSFSYQSRTLPRDTRSGSQRDHEKDDDHREPYNRGASEQQPRVEDRVQVQTRDLEQPRVQQYPRAQEQPRVQQYPGAQEQPRVQEQPRIIQNGGNR